MPRPNSNPDEDTDLLDSLIQRLQEGAADHLERRMREAETIKASEEASSQRRLEKMWELEHERQRAIAQEKAEQQRQEKRLIRLVLISAGTIILIVILLTIVLGIML